MGTFKLPDLGEGLAEAEIIQWHVKPGDRVVVDQPMVSVETAKAVVEVPVPYSGTVTALHGAVGAIIATGAPLVDFDSGTVVGTMPATSEEEYAEPAIERNRARGGARARTLPAARVLARRLGVDLSSLSGSGQAGLITLDDVLRHAPAAGNASSQSRAEPNLDPNAEPLRGPRRAMAHAMALTRDQITGSTVCDDADIHHWQRRGDYMVRLVRAMIAACRIEPALNAWFDAANNLRTLHRHIDLGIAVDTPAGLLAPVLRDVGAKSPEAVRAALMALKDAAHQRTTAPDELRGFTIMLSNFGTLAGRYGIPLVAPPAVAILGAGKVRLDVVAVAGEAGAADQVAVHRRLPLSLSFDHRVVTGGEACRFLAALITDLEKPD